jgi:hypothetical protein
MHRPLALALLLATTTAAADQVPVVTVRATLVEDNQAPHCGGLHIWWILHFDASKDTKAVLKPGLDRKRVPVAVPCPELPRDQYGPDGGNAGVLTKGTAYTLQLGPYGKGSWDSNRSAYPALRIDK